MHEILTEHASDVTPENDITKMQCTDALVYDDTTPSSGVAVSGLLGECDKEIEALFDSTCAQTHAAEKFESFFGTARSSPVTSNSMLVESDKELAALVGSTSVSTHAAQDLESVFGTTSRDETMATEAAAIETLLAISTLALPLPVSVGPSIVPLVAIKHKIKVCQCDLSGCDAFAIFDSVRLSNTSCAVKGGVQGESIRLDMRKNGLPRRKSVSARSPLVTTSAATNARKTGLMDILL